MKDYRSITPFNDKTHFQFNDQSEDLGFYNNYFYSTLKSNNYVQNRYKHAKQSFFLQHSLTNSFSQMKKMKLQKQSTTEDLVQKRLRNYKSLKKDYDKFLQNQKELSLSYIISDQQSSPKISKFSSQMAIKKQQNKTLNFLNFTKEKRKQQIQLYKKSISFPDSEESNSDIQENESLKSPVEVYKKKSNIPARFITQDKFSKICTTQESRNLNQIQESYKFYYEPDKYNSIKLKPIINQFVGTTSCKDDKNVKIETSSTKHFKLSSKMVLNDSFTLKNGEASSQNDQFKLTGFSKQSKEQEKFGRCSFFIKLDKQKERENFQRQQSQFTGTRVRILKQKTLNRGQCDMFDNQEEEEKKKQEEKIKISLEKQTKKQVRAMIGENRRKKLTHQEIGFLLMDGLRHLKKLNITPQDLMKHKVFSYSPFEKEGSYEFIKLVKLGLIDKIKLMLQKNKYLIYDFDYVYLTPLHWAVKHGFYDIVKLLIQKGADVDAKDMIGRTSLYLSISQMNYNNIERQKKELKRMKVQNKNLIFKNSIKNDAVQNTTTDDVKIIQWLLYKQACPWSNDQLDYRELCKDNYVAQVLLKKSIRIHILIAMMPANQRIISQWEKKGANMLLVPIRSAEINQLKADLAKKQQLY